MVSARSFPAIIGTADMMLKSSGVVLVGFEKIGSGHCTAIVRGGIADVRIAVEAGAETANKFGQFVGKSVIARPQANLEVVLPISSRFAQFAIEPGESPFANRAVGLLETRGFPAMVGAADAMLKAGEVELAAYETTGDGLCTAIVRGSIASVAVAIEAGMYEAERIGELHAIMVIPRALEDLERAMPIAAHWLAERSRDRAQPVALPMSVKVEEKERVALPQLDEIPIERPVPVEMPIERERSDLP